MRNGANHTRMPSLPTNIKGSIGNGSGIPRDVGNGMPSKLNGWIDADWITV